VATEHEVIPFNGGWLHTLTGRWVPRIAGAQDPDPDPQPDPTPDPEPDPNPDPEPDPDPSKDDAAVLRAENQRLKREAAQREKEKRQQEREAARLEDQRKAQQGEWQKLAEERADRITELEGQIQERDRKDAERNQRSTVEKVADRLNFRRPKRAYVLLMDELGDDALDTLADEQLTEAALKRLAKAEPELVDIQRRSGAPVGGRGNGGQPTPEQEHLDFLRQIGVGAPQ
jgi:alanyl-tRNA synthetase